MYYTAVILFCQFPPPDFSGGFSLRRTRAEILQRFSENMVACSAGNVVLYWHGINMKENHRFCDRKEEKTVLRGYQNYRGRRSAAIKLLIAVLVVILVAACSFLFIQRYVTYTDDGNFRIDLPEFLQWMAPKEKEPDEKEPPDAPQEDTGAPEDSGQDSQGVNLIIDEPEDQEPVPEQTPVVTERRLVRLDALPADGAALQETLAASGANGFVWRVRDNAGALHYSSNAGLKDAVLDSAVPTETLAGLCGTEGVTSVALFNCFHDSYYAFVNMADAAICQSNGYVWYDNMSYFWLDPAKEQARSYVTSLAVECAQMGFDELLLEEMTYPTSGKLQKISYKGNTIGKTDALVLFLTELKAALEPYGVRLGLLVGEDLINAGSNTESGQDLAALLPLVDAVYTTTGDPAGAQAILDAAAGGDGPDLVPLTAAPQEGQWCIAG